MVTIWLLDPIQLLLHYDLCLYWVSFIENLFDNSSEYYSRDSEGSSLPEMKAVLAGVHISTFLSIKAFIGKFVGVTLAIVGGLSLGRYGSFVHMSGVIAH